MLLLLQSLFACLCGLESSVLLCAMHFDFVDPQRGQLRLLCSREAEHVNYVEAQRMTLSNAQRMTLSVRVAPRSGPPLLRVQLRWCEWIKVIRVALGKALRLRRCNADDFVGPRSDLGKAPRNTDDFVFCATHRATRMTSSCVLCTDRCSTSDFVGADG
jgi:hypothetical protein